VQDNILQKYLGADVAVYAIWFDMVPSDDRSAWHPESLPDARVLHFWDSQQNAGRWFGSHITNPGSNRIEWDAYFLYGRDAAWAEVPTSMVSWGRTIVRSRDRLQNDFRRLVVK
jgi:hypothetical protein